MLPNIFKLFAVKKEFMVFINIEFTSKFSPKKVRESKLFSRMYFAEYYNSKYSQAFPSNLKEFLRQKKKKKHLGVLNGLF